MQEKFHRLPNELKAQQMLQYFNLQFFLLLFDDDIYKRLKPFAKFSNFRHAQTCSAMLIIQLPLLGEMAAMTKTIVLQVWDNNPDVEEALGEVFQKMGGNSHYLDVNQFRVNDFHDRTLVALVQTRPSSQLLMNSEW